MGGQSYFKVLTLFCLALTNALCKEAPKVKTSLGEIQGFYSK